MVFSKIVDCVFENSTSRRKFRLRSECPRRSGCPVLSCKNRESFKTCPSMRSGNRFGVLFNIWSPIKLLCTQTCWPQIYQQQAINSSISSSCNKSVKIRLATTCPLQNCYDLLLKQLEASQWITSFDNQLATRCRKSRKRIIISTC